MCELALLILGVSHDFRLGLNECPWVFCPQTQVLFTRSVISLHGSTVRPVGSGLPLTQCLEIIESFNIFSTWCTPTILGDYPLRKHNVWPSLSTLKATHRYSLWSWQHLFSCIDQENLWSWDASPIVTAVSRTNCIVVNKTIKFCPQNKPICVIVIW